MTEGEEDARSRDLSALSPSLLAPTKRAASYEVKFLVPHPAAQQIEAWARQYLALDPHADPALNNAYTIRSVYFDTANLDVYHQSPSYKRRKFRLRQYGKGGHAGVVFLERKTKSGDKVAKRRTVIRAEELSRLHDPLSGPEPQNGNAADWPGSWFHRRIHARQLKPRCVIGYERVAYIGMNAEGPMRLTMDRNIHCALTETHDLHVASAGIPLLTDVVILELKYRTALPALFKDLIQEMNLSPGRVSKYRTGMDAWGISANGKETA